MIQSTSVKTMKERYRRLTGKKTDLMAREHNSLPGTKESDRITLWTTMPQCLPNITGWAELLSVAIESGFTHFFLKNQAESRKVYNYFP